MLKLLTKSKTTVLLTTLTLLAFISLFVNALLFFKKDSIEKMLSHQLKTPIQIHNIFYSPPNYLMLKNVALFENNSLNKTPILKSDSIFINFSFLNIFTKRQLTLKKILINGSQINKSNINLIFKELIIPRTNYPLKDDLKIEINNAQLMSNVSNSSRNTISTNIQIKLTDRYILAQGDINNLFSKNSNPLKFNFKARKTSNGTFIENIKLTHSNIDTNIWGTLRKNQLQLKGYSLAKLNNTQRKSSIKQKPKNFLSKITKKNNPTGLPFVDIFLLDLEANLTLTSKKININNLSFKLNDIPIVTTGYISLEDTINFYLESKITQKQTKNFEKFPFEKIEIKNSGSLNNKLLTLNNKTHILFTPQARINELELSLKNLQANVLPLTSFRAIIENAKFNIKINKKNYSTSADQLRFRTQLSKNNDYNMKFQASLYNGFIRGTIQLPKNLNSKKLTTLVNFKNIETQSIYNSINSFPNIKGKLSGKISTKISPSLKFNGNATITNGTIYDNDFFGWMANYFDLPGLEEVNFNSLSLKFSGTSELAEVDNIFLKSNEFGIKGHFYINKNRFVNSQVSLLFQRDFLKQSKKLKRLTKLVAQDINPLDFNFKLSGNIDAVNFQWLYSDFKKSLEERIPKRYQKKIEESIEDIITSNAKSQTDMAQLTPVESIEKSH